jgi:hypothetical protein
LGHLGEPLLVEHPAPENNQKAVIVHRIKGFAEIDLEDNGRRLSNVTGPEQVRSVDNVFRNAPPGKEARLVCVNQRVDAPLKSRGKGFGDRFHNTVLEGNGMELGGVCGGVVLREEDQESSVNASKVDGAIVEGGKNAKNISSNRLPKGGKKGRTEPIGPRTR